MQFRVLGPFEVRASDGKLVRIGATKHRRLLATLLLAANRPVNVDRLAEALGARTLGCSGAPRVARSQPQRGRASGGGA